MEMGEWTPAVRVKTRRETGFVVRSTYNTTGPCGVVRVQTSETVELYGHGRLSSSGFARPVQVQSVDNATSPDLPQPAPFIESREKGSQTEDCEKEMEVDEAADRRPETGAAGAGSSPRQEKRVRFGSGCEGERSEHLTGFLSEEPPAP